MIKESEVEVDREGKSGTKKKKEASVNKNREREEAANPCFVDKSEGRSPRAVVWLGAAAVVEATRRPQTNSHLLKK